MSDSVAAQTRAANVDAFIVWSACSTRQVSRISASRSAGAAPRSWSRKFAARLRPGSGGGHVPAAPGGVVGGDQDRLLGGEPGRLPRVGRGRVGVLVRVVRAGQRDQAAQRLHRALRRGDLRQRGADQLAQGAAADQFGPVAVQLGPAGRGAALQQVGDLLEGRGPGQLMDVVTAVKQQARLAIDVAQRGGCGDDVSQSPGRLVRHFVYLPIARSAVYFRPPRAPWAGRLRIAAGPGPGRVPGKTRCARAERRQ